MRSMRDDVSAVADGWGFFFFVWWFNMGMRVMAVWGWEYIRLVAVYMCYSRKRGWPVGTTLAGWQYG